METTATFNSALTECERLRASYKKAEDRSLDLYQQSQHWEELADKRCKPYLKVRDQVRSTLEAAGCTDFWEGSTDSPFTIAHFRGRLLAINNGNVVNVQIVELGHDA